MSVREKIMCDYIGFTYGDKHSSQLGIVRVSDGSRFNENLLPTIQDKTVQIPGGDGAYYFGSYYTQKQISISFAFDDLTEEEIAALRRHFGDKKIHDLIFDETPYKAYQAKVTGTATLKYLVFDEGQGNKRIYKGEGTIQFTCYSPFARCTITRQGYESRETTKERLTWSESNPSGYKNIEEWWAASGITWDRNFGDVDAPFIIKIWSNEQDTPDGGSITTSNGSIHWRGINGSSSEPARIIDTRLGLVYEIIRDKEGNEKLKLNMSGVTGDLTLKIPAGAITWTASEDEKKDVTYVGCTGPEYDRYYF